MRPTQCSSRVRESGRRGNIPPAGAARRGGKDASVPTSVRASTGKQAAALALLAITLVMVAIAACETAEGLKKDVSSLTVRDSTPPTSTPAPRYYAPARFESEPDIRVRIAKGVTKKEVGRPEQILVRPVQTSSSALSQR